MKFYISLMFYLSFGMHLLLVNFCYISPYRTSKDCSFYTIPFIPAFPSVAHSLLISNQQACLFCPHLLPLFVHVYMLIFFFLPVFFPLSFLFPSCLSSQTLSFNFSQFEVSQIESVIDSRTEELWIRQILH